MNSKVVWSELMRFYYILPLQKKKVKEKEE